MIILKPYIMKRLLTLALFIISLAAAGQQYNNEWIRFPQTYYKFKIANPGLYRIPKSTLDAAGIGGTSIQYYELWKNGKQVPIYTSVSSGPLGSNDYIEFWGEANDGKPDQALYRNPAYQHTAASSLMTDTAVYFLSVNTTGTGSAYFDPGNNVAANVLPAEPYFFYKAGTYYRNKINKGFAAVVGEYVYSASYDKGEFWSSNSITPASPLTTTINGLTVYSGGPDATINFGTMGDALNARHIQVSVNGTLLVDSVMDYFTDVNTSAALPLSLISSGTAAVQFKNTAGVSSDRMVASYFEISYPKPFSFDNQSNYKFSLPASGDKYLEITNFNYGSAAPELLNLTTGERITGDISSPGVVKLVIAGGGARDFVLVSEDPSNVITVNAIVSKTFKKFTDPANQGNYLIISNKILFTGTNGNNPVDDYKNYRASAAGGSYTSQVIDMDELVDQFAFGIKKHPSSIKNFIRYARNNFSTPLKYVFLIGRGVAYNDYQKNQSDPKADLLNLVPTFGSPGSDNMLSSQDAASPVAVTPIGRLSVVRGSEIEDYLEKVREYENVQQNSSNTIAAKGWMKNVVHVTGSSDPYLGTVLCNYMGVYKRMIQDTIYGGRVVTFCKASTNAVEQINNEKITDLFAEGISILTYFGHSSTTTLEFNLDNPQAYNNQGKYPVFFVNGCSAGDFFTYNPSRLLVNETLSEKFVLAKQRGSIAFVASTHYGIVNYLNIYLNSLYALISRKDYGKSLGETVRDALQQMITVTGPNDFYARAHAEEMSIHGDPSIYLNQQAKPDYVIEEPQVIINPSFISVAENNFQVKVRMVNLGRAVNDSIYLDIKRQYPDGSVELILHKKMVGIRYADSVTISVPIIAVRDKGTNKIFATIDAGNLVDEISESNNAVSKDVFIYEDEARAVFPFEYAIVNDATQKVFASTADPFSSEKSYVMEMDTTALFSSSGKVTKTLVSKGGALEFDPAISYHDSTVYYWRVSVSPGSKGYRWSNSSFVYIAGPDKGFNQSHYFQHQNSETQRISLDDSRVWKYNTQENNVYFKLGTWVSSAFTESDMSIVVNSGNVLIHNTCNFSALAFTVFDPVTMKPWLNITDSSTGKGLYKSERNDCYSGRQNNFEFKYTDSVSRKNAMDFMDQIPDGVYVSIRAFVLDPTSYPSQPQAFVDGWKKDTLLYGSNNSLYHRIYGQGYTDLDSFYRVRPWIFFYKKNNQELFAPQSATGKGTFDNLTLSVYCSTPDTLGYITSPVFGPAREWKEVIWRGKSLENPSTDNPVVSVIGVDNNKIETVLFTLDKTSQNFDVSTVNAVQYPYMKLKMRNIDSVTLTPYQLNYWRIHYVPVPEGSLAANVFVNTRDTLEKGESFKFGIAFKNISNLPFDSISVKASVVDKNNVSHSIIMPKTKPLVPGDTTNLSFLLDSKDFTDANTLFLDVNPDNNQPEQYHFNNFLYKSFFVRNDRTNPLLDVTFDGVHILNKDLVSARPHIQIRLKDEAKFLLLNDTALSSIQIRFPDGSVRTQNFDNDTLRFTPASSGSDNTATVDFFPQFAKQYKADGDEYELIVKGKDRSGNKAGATEYRISFTIISKPMISNLLNYPNPFSTSTAFVFTITGSDVPQNMKIQVLTVTGKIVREITKDELGPIHIGRNITDFKWNGTDQFGQKLGNGVYLYRFVTSLDGKRMDKYKAEGDNTDMYFNNGYGKMYLMR